jgi:hypothetical protein
LASVGSFRLKSGAKTSGIIVQQRKEIICNHLAVGPTARFSLAWGSWSPTLATEKLARIGHPAWTSLATPHFLPSVKKFEGINPSLYRRASSSIRAKITSGVSASVA